MCKRILVLVSGSGSNLQVLIDETEAKKINGKIVGVLSDKEGVFALERAKKHGINTYFLPKKEHQEKLLSLIKEINPDLIVLAGFLSIIGADVVKEFSDKIINLHPALIPSFCGDGMYGDKVHRAVLERGVKISGVTVHFVDEGTDSGPIILQDTVPVYSDDTVEKLAERIHKLEHKLLPEAVKLFCEDQIKISGKKTYISK